MGPSDFYDGLYFFTSSDKKEKCDKFNVVFFTLEDEYTNGVPVETTDVGDRYHIAFFDFIDGHVEKTEVFEAILSSPGDYVKNLIDTNIMGCILRKTNKSEKWFAEYLTKFKEKFKTIKYES